MSSDVWVDVSHIIGWQGNLTGIERVEYHLIKHYFYKTNARFFYFDLQKNYFIEADRRFVEKKIIRRTSEEEYSVKRSDKTLAQILRRKIARHSKARLNGTVIILAGLWDETAYISALEQLSTNNLLVHVVYDMIPIIRPQYVVDFLPPVFANYVYKVLPHCAKILTISKSTADDTKTVLQKNNLSTPPIRPFRLGDEISRSSKPIKPSSVERDFILSVGTIEVRKNHQLLLSAQSVINKEIKQTTPIIIAGKRGWLTEDFQKLADKDGSGIIILDTVTDSEMRWLYENCLFTIFPSLYEGWGLPVAESLNYGKVTLSSNSSSLPEAGGKFADYFSPNSVQQASQLILKYLNPTVRKKREEFIKKNHKPIKWEYAAEEFARLVASN